MSNYSLPKNVFLHLLMMAMLYATVISVMVLLTAYVNVLFPDQLDYFINYYDTIRYSSSVLLVSFAVFSLMNWIVARDIKKIPEVKQSGVRRWLIYLTIFVAAVTMIVYLIRFVFNFYSGDLTLPFVLKVLIVFLLSAFVFGYYLMDLYDRIKKPSWIMYFSVTLVLVSLVAGFFIVGSPAHQRQVRFDEQRVRDLSDIQWQLVNFWQKKDYLPKELSEIRDNITGFAVPIDPGTGENYRYTVMSKLTFKLCANFALESQNETVNSRFNYYPEVPVKGAVNWTHGAGEVCFEKTIDPEIYDLK